MLFVLIMENGSETDGRSNLNLNSELMDNLNNTIIDSMLF